MPTTPDAVSPPIVRDPWRESLHASHERRAAAFRRRRRRLRGRSGAAVAAISLTLLAGGAMAATPAGPSGASLRTGATGAPVSALQEALGITPDGVYGAQTRAAVRRYQRRSGLTVDGIAGPATLKALGLAATPVAQASGGGAAFDAHGATAPGSAIGTGPTATATAALTRIARCESGGDPTAVSSGGTYRGKYQFSRETWRAVGGTGDPAAAPEAEQDRRAALLLERQGRSAWPVCGA